MRRWNNSTKTLIGMVMMTAAAAIDPVGCWNWELPVKKAIAAGTVRALLVDVSEMANRKSFQQKMNTRIAVVNMPGRGQRRDDLGERLERRGAVHLGRLLQLPRDLPEERRQRVDRERQPEGHVRDDQPGQVSNSPMLRATC